MLIQTTILAGIAFLANYAKSERKDHLNEEDIYLIEGEIITYQDLSEDYFIHRLNISKTKFPEKDKDFVFKINKPFGLYKEESSFPVISPNEVDSDGKKITLEILFKEREYRIRQIGNLKFIETFVTEATDPRDPKGGKRKFLKMIEIEFKIETGSFKVTQDLLTERYECLNKAGNMLVTAENHFGRLMEILYEVKYGHFKQCFSISETPTKDPKNDVAFFQLDRLAYKGFHENALEKPVVLISRIDPDIRSEKIEVKKFKSQALFLRYYDDILLDTVYFIKDTPYIFFRDIGQKKSEINGDFLIIPEHKIQNIYFFKEKFLIIVANFSEDVTKVDKTYTLIHYIPDSTKADKGEHIFKPLDKCLEDLSKRLIDCFLVIKEGIYLNDYRLPNDFSIVIELLTPWKTNSGIGKRLQAFRWDENAERFQFLVDKKMKDRVVVHRYDSPQFFVNIEEKEDKKIGYKYHTVHISPRSYYSEMVDQKIELPVDYGKKMVPVKERDELISYFFDHVSGFLFRRGRLSLKLYYFMTPRLIIFLKDQKSSPVYDKATAHLCNKPKVIKLYFRRGKISRKYDEKKVNFCYSPKLKVGSYFPSKLKIEEEKVKYPTGYSLSTHINNFVLGSFLKVSSNHTNKPQNQQTSIKYLRDRKYEVRFIYHRNSFESMYMLLIQSNEGRPMLNLVLSDAHVNTLYTGPYHQGEDRGELKEKENFTDFRTILGVETMENYTTFVQIKDLSYFIQLGRDESSLKPWGGLNGICKDHVKLKHKGLGSSVLCYFQKKFFVKYVDSKGITRTKQVQVEYYTKKFLKNSKRKFMKLLTSDEFHDDFMMIYTEDTDVKSAFFELYGDLHPIVQILTNNSLPKIHETKEGYYKLSQISEIKLAGRYLIYIVNTEKVHSFLVSYISYNFSFFLLKEIILPDKVRFMRIPKMVVNKIETKIDKEAVSKMDVGFIKRSVACKVYLTVQNPITKNEERIPSLMVMDTESHSINSLSIIQLKKGYDFLEFGPLYSESFSSREIYFAILAKPKNLGESEMENLQNYTIFLTKGKGQIVRFSVNSAAKDVLNLKIPRDVTKTFNFTIESVIYNNLERRRNEEFNRNVNEKKDHPIVLKDRKISMKMKYAKWYQDFKNVGKNTKVVQDYQKSLDLGSVEKDDKFIEFNLKDSKLYTQGEKNTRYIKLNTEKYSIGNVVDSFGFVDSTLEKYLGLVRVPHNNQTDEKNKERCFKPEKGVNVTIWAFCNLDVDHINRTKYGCSNANGKDTQFDVKTLDEKDEDKSKIWVMSPQFIKEYVDRANYCSTNNEESFKIFNSVNMVKRSLPKSLKKFVFYIEGVKSGGEGEVVTFVITDLSAPARNYYSKKQKDELIDQGEEFRVYLYVNFTVYKSQQLKLKIDLSKCSKDVYLLREDEDKGEYSFLVVVYEYNPKTQLYMTTRFYRLNLKKTTYIKKDGKQVKIPGQLIVSSAPYEEFEPITSNIQTYFLKEEEGKARLLFLNPFWLNKDKLRIYLKVYHIEFQNHTISSTKNFRLKHKYDYIEENYFDIDMGRFFDNEYLYASQPKVITPDELQIDLYQKTHKEFLFFILSFPLSNDFLIKIPMSKLNKDSQNSHIEEFEISPISNPFIGFMPSSDSPPSILIGANYFHLRTYGESSYLVSYKLNFSEFVKVKITEDPDGNGFQNIFLVKEENSQYKKYIDSKGIIKLKERPVSYRPFVHMYGKNSRFEHKLVYTTFQGDVYTKKFTNKMNIVIKSDNVASNKITVFIKGLHSMFVEVNFKLSGNVRQSPNSKFWDWVKIFTVIIISSVTAYMLKYFIALSKKKEENREIKKIRKRTGTAFLKVLSDAIHKKEIESGYYENGLEESDYDEGNQKIGNMADYIDDSYDDYGTESENVQEKKR